MIFGVDLTVEKSHPPVEHTVMLPAGGVSRAVADTLVVDELLLVLLPISTT